MRSLGKRAWRWSGPVLLCPVALFLLGADNPSSPAQIEAEFAGICRQIRDSYDPFYGELRSRQLAARLAAGVEEPQTRAALEAVLGREYLKLLRTDEAIALLDKAAKELSHSPSLSLETRIYLGLAYLQAAEDENCILSHTADSCLLPIRPG
ncbi:MAG: hypothetical protein ACE5EG_03965, partial [Thermoanaerobaculia bacterium]